MAVNTFTTVAELNADALWLAGELQSASSPYYERATGYLNAVQTALVSGGGLGDRSLPQVDWWWSYSRYRGAITLLNAFNFAKAITLTVTQDSTTATFGSMTAALTLLDYYLILDAVRDQMPRISVHAAGTTTATLALAWKPTTQTTITGWVAAPLDYALPTDFLRFSGPIAIGRDPYRVDVTDLRTLEAEWHRGSIVPGTPSSAALVNDNYLRFNSYVTDGPLVAEFEYIVIPAALTIAGSDPVMPQPHRRLLSLGAAYLLMLEKGDSRSERVYSMFTAAWEAMQVEQAKSTDGPLYGRIITRPNGLNSNRFPLRTSTGLIIG